MTKAILDRVTITGADDSIEPTELIKLTEEFPFVEWGILVSASSQGKPRFPTDHWLNGLSLLTRIPHQLPLALHVCGKYTRDVLLGIDSLPDVVHYGYSRVQLNFHAERAKCDPSACAKLLFDWRQKRYVKQVIFQVDGAGGNEHMLAVHSQYDPDFWFVECNPLFDVSGGAGVLPNEWPRPFWFDEMEEPAYHGYAGGLGPDNLAEQLPRIMEAASQPDMSVEFDADVVAQRKSDPPPGATIWIDMETRVRSDNDRKFDLAKVRRCLEIAKPFVTEKRDAK